VPIPLPDYRRKTSQCHIACRFRALWRQRDLHFRAKSSWKALLDFRRNRPRYFPRQLPNLGLGNFVIFIYTLSRFWGVSGGRIRQNFALRTGPKKRPNLPHSGEGLGVLFRPPAATLGGLFRRPARPPSGRGYTPSRTASATRWEPDLTPARTRSGKRLRRDTYPQHPTRTEVPSRRESGPLGPPRDPLREDPRGL